MTTATKRRPTTRRKPTRRPPRRTLTVTLGPVAGQSRAKKNQSWSWRFVRWSARWTGRTAAWGGRQAVRRTAGHVSRTRTAWREWADVKAEHGRDAVVTDLFTGKVHKAHEVDGQGYVELDAPTGGHPEIRLEAPTGGDPTIRARQDEDARAVRERLEQQRVEHMMSKRVRPPWWERCLAKLGHRKIDMAPYTESLRARMAVMAQRRDRLAREAELYGQAPPHPRGWDAVGRYVDGTDGWGQPDPPTDYAAMWSWARTDPGLVTVPADPNEFTDRRRSNRTRGDGSMANSIRTWGDLADPQIDPFDFPEELPQHFAEVAALLTREAEDIESAADSGAKGDELFAGYAEYLNSADVKPSVVSPISDASEEIACAVRMIRNAAEAMSRAATLAEQAQRAAEAEYGDFQMPRFDRANAG